MQHRPNVGALAANLLLVYVLYAVARGAFALANWDVYGGLQAGYMLRLFAAGIIFDTTAILYTNVLFILLFLFPLHWKECRPYYQFQRWLYAVVNGLMLASSLADCVYFRFTGRRTTASVLQEFAHEGMSVVGTVGHEVLVHWPLLVLGLACGVALYFGFRMPRVDVRPRLATYYPVQIVSLALAGALTVAGMRGGFTMATRPITLSNANQYADRPADASLVLNTPFSLLRTMGKKTFAVPQYMTDDEMERTYSPLHRPKADTAFRAKNVVVFILEGFSKEFSALFNPALYPDASQGAMPFLDSLMRVGISYRYSYANGRKSIDGMPSVLSGIPSFVEPFFLTPAALNEVGGLARELGRHKGYTTAFFHGAMNGSMGFQAFAHATGFQRYYGRTEYNADDEFGGDADFDGTWAIWDEEFLQYFCKHTGRLPQPFVSAVFTASSHGPYVVPARYQGKFPQGAHPLHQCVAYTDAALRRFFERARHEQWFYNTLFVFTADHTNGNTSPEYQTDLGYYSVPIALYAPAIEQVSGGVDSLRIANQMDIMPTVLGLLGYDRPYIAFGQDLVATPPHSTFGVQYVPASGIYQYAQGEWLIQSAGERVERAYRFRTDSVMAHQALAEMPDSLQTTMLHSLQALIQQYMQRMNSNRLVERGE